MTERTRARSRAEQSRLNGARSRGPTTPAGLARASSNATSHGLVARAVVIVGELAEDYEAWRDACVRDLCPEGPLQHALVDRAAELTWRLRRAGVAEARLTAAAEAAAERRAIALVAASRRDAGSALQSPESLAGLRERAAVLLAEADAATELLEAASDAPITDPTATATLVAGLSGLSIARFGDLGDVGRPLLAPVPIPATVGALRRDLTLRLIVDLRRDLGDDYDDDDYDEATGREALRDLLTAARRQRLQQSVECMNLRAEALLVADRLRAEAPVDHPQVRRHEAHLHRLLRATLRTLADLRARARVDLSGTVH